MSDVAAEKVLDFLAPVYDCVLQPEKWGSTLGVICDDLKLAHSVLGYYETASGTPLLRVQYGMEPEWFDKMPAYASEMTDYWGGVSQILSYPLGEVVVHSIAQPKMQEGGRRFAAEWCAPQGIKDFIALSLSADRIGVSTLVFTSHRKLDDADEQALAILRFLTAHIRRVVTISRVLELRSIEAQSFEATLEALPNGIILLDAETRVVHANAAAETLLKAGDQLRVINGRLALLDPTATLALVAAVKACGDARTIGQRGIGIPARSQSGSGSILHVLPLRYGDLKKSLNPRAIAALFITSDQSRPRLPGDALKLLYDMTPAEVRICELITEGLTPTEVAKRLGVAPSTARTHLLRVFDKTGVHRQADLVRLIASLAITSTGTR